MVDKAPPSEEPQQHAGFAKQCREGLVAAKATLSTLTAQGTQFTPQQILELNNKLSIQLQDSMATAGLMQNVHPDASIREAARKCEQEVSEFASELGRNRKLYDLYAAIDASGFDANTKRLVAHELRAFRRSGVDRDQKTRDRLKQIDEKLTKLGQQFGKNITEDVRHILVKREDMDGLPADYIKAHAPDKDGNIKITTNYPDLFPFLDYAKSTEKRREIYMENRSRGGEKNETILKEILTLRHEKANLLGYKTWADYITEDKMIKNAQAVTDFINKIVKVADKRATADYRELLTFKRKSVPKAERVEAYEKSYYSNLVRKQNYAFDAQVARTYFPYRDVEAGLLAITSEIYNIRYVPVKDASVWHETVKVFDVLRDGTSLGRIYLDMHPREGKYKHAAQFTKKSGVIGKQLPEGVLVCNFPNPNEGSGLMEHTQVTTMFHEFGHLMHHVLGGHQKWINQSGVATEWDFVEAPSQMFEEWAWNHDTLKRFAKHHKTGEVIPKDLVDKMRKADKFGLGIGTKQQMFYASISLNFHNVDPSTFNMGEEVQRLQNTITPFRHLEGTRFHASFGHLEGYTAMYYTYMWSLVIAKDLLTPFQQHGLMNKEWTQRYRDKILVPGGTKDAADLVADFLGRPYNFDAFEKFLSN